MAQNLKDLNRRIGAAKKKKTPAKAPPRPEVDVNRIAEALEKSKQPIVNLPDRRPVEYQLEVTKRNNNGAIVSAKIIPKFSEES
jgi:hypothetical protein